MPLTLLIGIGLLALGAVRLGASIASGRLRAADAVPPLANGALPPLLLQIPVFNECEVVIETLRVASALEYPPGRLTIQILDDSTDETSTLVASFLSGLDGVCAHHWQHHRRANRAGWKAGALAEGLRGSCVEFVAILDADFRPEPGWLRRMMAELIARPDAAFVQSAWAFESGSGARPGNNSKRPPLNGRIPVAELQVTPKEKGASGLAQIDPPTLWTGRPSYSFLAQSSSLSFYFNCIQSTYSSLNMPFHFNGTAGIWRVAAITLAGGWLSRTIVEDMDLSYRALLQNQRGFHIPNTAVASQLPATIPALLTQQRRWALGAGQCARLHLAAVLRAPRPLRWGAAGALGLLSGLGWVLLLAHLILLPLASTLPSGHLVPASLACGFFALSQFLHEQRTASFFKSLILTANALSLAIRICPQTAVAAIAGWLGAATDFARTPKGPRTRAFRSFSPPDFLHLIIALWLASALIPPAASANPVFLLPTLFAIVSLLRAA